MNELFVGYHTELFLKQFIIYTLRYFCNLLSGLSMLQQNVEYVKVKYFYGIIKPKTHE